MTNEEMEKTIHFILEQQAQFAADMQIVKEQMGKLTDAVITLTGFIGKVSEAQTETAKAQAMTAEAQARADEKIAELAEQGRATEERLNAFILIVERYISERRNGNKRDDQR